MHSLRVNVCLLYIVSQDYFAKIIIFLLILLTENSDLDLTLISILYYNVREFFFGRHININLMDDTVRARDTSFGMYLSPLSF